jgi:hypothetical protein
MTSSSDVLSTNGAEIPGRREIMTDRFDRRPLARAGSRLVRPATTGAVAPQPAVGAGRADGTRPARHRALCTGVPCWRLEHRFPPARRRRHDGDVSRGQRPGGLHRDIGDLAVAAPAPGLAGAVDGVLTAPGAAGRPNPDRPSAGTRPARAGRPLRQTRRGPLRRAHPVATAAHRRAAAPRRSGLAALPDPRARRGRPLAGRRRGSRQSRRTDHRAARLPRGGYGTFLGAVSSRPSRTDPGTGLTAGDPGIRTGRHSPAATPD